MNAFLLAGQLWVQQQPGAHSVRPSHCFFPAMIAIWLVA